MSEGPTRTVGEALIDLLAGEGVACVFGIPGAHTIELYRGLAGSPIRHVTPRHEQGAGFMADGYARVSGRPGVCFVITGPGLTNTLTAMAQARQDSVPMLVVSGAGRRSGLGMDRGALHEVAGQSAAARAVARFSHTLIDASTLPAVIGRAFAILGSGRPGPVHVEIPVDVMAERIALPPPGRTRLPAPAPAPEAIAEAAALLAAARRPAVFAGGGARRADAALRPLAEALDAPVVTTVNGRGLLAGHPLRVPASPSLAPVRALLAEADLVLSVGTELGPTDCDMYVDGGFPDLASHVRIDVDRGALAAGPRAAVAIEARAEDALPALLRGLGATRRHGGAERAARARAAALGALSPADRTLAGFVARILAALPDAIVVGDSTRPVYAGNLYADLPRPGSWFNAATGYGALGYAPGAAIGARLAAPDRPVVCLVGDGGLQLSAAELGSALDAGAPVIFVVWNNEGYGEIEAMMDRAGIAPEGVRPSAPDHLVLARAFGLAAERLGRSGDLEALLARAAGAGRPTLIEVPEAVILGRPR